jgi:hypothetical protein
MLRAGPSLSFDIPVLQLYSRHRTAFIFPGALSIASDVGVGIANFLYSEDFFLAHFAMGLMGPVMGFNLHFLENTRRGNAHVPEFH